MSKRIIGIVFVLLVCGCVPPNKVMVFDPDLKDSILEYQKPTVATDHPNYALDELLRGSLFFEHGDYSHSDSRFSNACQVMGQIKGDDREGAAIALNEYARTYRGSPYERSAAYLYRAICRYNLGDYSGALAASRNAIEADKETYTKVAKDKEDFTIAYVVAALCYARLGEVSNATQQIELANQHLPPSARLDATILEANFIGIVGVGYGPSAIQGSFASREFVAGECLQDKIEIVLDDRVVTTAREMTDLLYQAQSNKSGEADAAAKGRAVGKFALSMALSVALGSNVNIQENRDLRCWWGLPREYYVFTAKVSPGTYTLSFRCYDKKGQRMPREEQIWYEFPVQQQPGRISYFHILNNAQNYAGLVSRPIADVLADKKGVGK